jgi:hypothetical protein
LSSDRAKGDIPIPPAPPPSSHQSGAEPSDAADPAAIAERFLDLWQDQMAGLASDPELAQMIGQVWSLWSAPFAGAPFSPAPFRSPPFAPNPVNPASAGARSGRADAGLTGLGAKGGDLNGAGLKGAPAKGADHSDQT